MDSNNMVFNIDKQKDDGYVREAEKAASIVDNSVKRGEFSELTLQLESLPSTGITREKYVFERQKLSINFVCFFVCIGITLILIYPILIYIGTLIYSHEFDFVVRCGIVIALLIILLNIIIISYIVSIYKFEKRYDTYTNVLRFKNIEIIDDLATYAKVSSERVVKDLSAAIKSKLIPQGHFGKDNIIFIVSNEIYDKYKEKQAVYDRYYRKQVEERLRMKERSKEMENILNKGQQYVDKIRGSNDIINDKIISQKLYRMEKVVSMILHEVDINPAKADQLGMFMNYYLPTTEKLLEAYIEIDEKQVKGDILERTKKDIESAIDKIIDSFEGILDKFYQEQAMDISSDISAMEIIMNQEGLTE